MERKLSERQRWAWLAASLSAPAAICACGLNWLWVLAVGAVAAGYYIYIERWLSKGGVAALYRALGGAGRGLAALTVAWLIFGMSWAANLADSAFPMVEGFPVLGWTMLALAAWGSVRGTAACGRCTGVLCLFLLVLYGVVVVFALPEVETQNLRPVGEWTDGGKAVGLALLPAAVWVLPVRRRENRTGWGMAAACALLAALLAAVTAGVLTPELAKGLPSPLYTLAQSVSLFGVIERIEPLLSAAMTMGVFCLLAAMACGCRELLAWWNGKRWSGAACCVAAGVFMGWAGRVKVEVLSLGGVICWVGLPLIAETIRGKRKKTTRNGG